MPTFSIYKDTETPRNSGADGLFQIAELRDHDDNDITSSFDQGKFYRDNAQLINDIATILNIPPNDIDIIEE